MWELHQGIRRVNRHSVWIPACGEANSLHYSAQPATMFLPSLGKSPERLLNPLLCILRPELCCTCQSGQTELGVPHLNSPDIWYSDWKYSEFSNFHRSVGSRRLAIPRPARAQTLALLRSGGPGRSAVRLLRSSQQACLFHDPSSDICHFGSAPHSAANAAAVIQDSALRIFWKRSRFPDKRQSFILPLISSLKVKHKPPSR